jgi:hypothetical protein
MLKKGTETILQHVVPIFQAPGNRRTLFKDTSSSNCTPGDLHSLRGLSIWDAVQPANYYATLLLVFYWCCCELLSNAVCLESSQVTDKTFRNFESFWMDFI